jgi:hypothetical protein
MLKPIAQKTVFLKRIACLLALVGLMAVPAAQAIAAGAASANTDASQSVTQAYGTDGTLQRGMIVRLDDKDPAKVAALESDQADNMHGVVVEANDAALTLSSNAAARQVYVATYGRYEVLVSDQNGAIKVGDYVSVSALNGVGMKADGKPPVVLGKATQPFNGSSQVVGTATLKDKTGKSVQVSLGRIVVDMSISHNPLKVQAQSSGITGYLQSVSSGVAGKMVAPARLYLSIFILFVTAVISGSILYGGIRSGIVSIGRNPLAKRSITRSLLQVIATSIIIFILGLFGVYLLLKL